MTWPAPTTATRCLVSSGVKSTEYRHSRSLRKQFPPLFLKHFFKNCLRVGIVACFFCCRQSRTLPRMGILIHPQPSRVNKLCFETRNGNFTGTALLDKQTGRIWTMGTGESKDGEIGDVEFRKATIYHVENGWVVFDNWNQNPGTGLFSPATGNARPPTAPPSR